MPRKFRPPAAKRRKRKTVSYEFDQAPLPADGAVAPGMPAAEVTADIIDQPEEGVRAADLYRRTSVKHITRDHSYVRGEIVRILLIAGFLMISLVITALFRN